jgi:hypothetical protein
MVCFILALSLWILTNLKMTIPSLIFTILVATFEQFLIRRYIELHAQGLKVSIDCLRVRVRHGPQIETGSFDVPVERFLACLRFHQRGKLEQLGIEIGSFD